MLFIITEAHGVAPQDGQFGRRIHCVVDEPFLKS
jgi:hypothetical protein